MTSPFSFAIITTCVDCIREDIFCAFTACRKDNAIPEGVSSTLRKYTVSGWNFEGKEENNANL